MRRKTPCCPARADRWLAASPTSTPRSSVRLLARTALRATYAGQGLARKYEWTDKGELTTTLIWIYKVQ